MELLSPISLAWLALLAPLVLLYVLKRRRARKVIASTLLWEAALRDLRAERPWQRLRPHLSLILQALALIAGALALARPSGAGQVPAGARLAVVIDTSASMAAREDGETRMDRARSLAAALARDLPPGGEMMIVAAGAEPDVLTPPTADRVELERALDALVVSGARSDLSAGVALAGERMHGAPAGSRIVVFTDAAFGGTVPLDARVPIEVRRVGHAIANHAITALDVRARSGSDALDAAEIFVRVARFGEGAGEVRVSARIDGGALLASRRVRVEDGAPQSVVMQADLPPDAEGRAAVVRAEIDVLQGDDPFALDDAAVAPSPAARRLPVVLVGTAPASVERVLRADRDVELYAAREALPRTVEGLFVFSGDAPRTPPVGDSIVVAPRSASIFGISLGAPVERASVVSWEEADPRLRFVRFREVHFGAVRPIRGGAAHPLLTTDAGPAIGVLATADSESTIVALDPDEGDWATDPSFVLFFRNLLERARARRAAGGIAPGSVGEPLRVPAPNGSEVRVVTPSGRVLGARSRGGVAIVPAPPEPGVHRVRIGERERFALRNLLDAEESDLAPRASFARHDGRALARVEEAIEHRELWPYLAMALLALFLLDTLWSTRKGAA